MYRALLCTGPYLAAYCRFLWSAYPMMARVGDPLKIIGPTAEKHYLNAVWKEL